MDGVVLRRELVAAIRAELDGSLNACLATVVVGDNPRCHILARGRRSAAEDAGLRAVGVDLPSAATQDEVEEALARLADDHGVHGIFVQLPLPAHLDPDRILRLVAPAKDVDGMGPDSVHAPPTAQAVVRLLDHYAVAVTGRRVVIVGRVAGMATLLARRGADVTEADEADEADEAAPDVCREADILIAAGGRPGSIGPDHVRPGAAVVDVTGDVDLERVEAIAGAVAPYPAGVGPVALACLLRNTLDAAKLRAVTSPPGTGPTGIDGL